MSKRLRSSRSLSETRPLWAGFLLVVFALTPTVVLAQSAAQLYSDAQAAYKRSNYAEAATLYQAADRAGYPDPILFYNLGVTHYKLAEYSQAEAAFATASTTAKLAPLALYNLGLVSRKAGEPREASGWFAQAARHPAASKKIRQLANKALRQLPQHKRVRPVRLELEKPKLSDFVNFSFDTGYATDSNIYRSPASSYVDLSQAAAPAIDPQVQSGSYIPVRAAAEFRWGTHEDSHFSLRYNFDGSFFTDSQYSNANRSTQEISLGGKALQKTARGYKHFDSSFVIARIEEQYYDRDDGTDQFVGLEDVSDRFNRTKFGPRIYYHRKRGSFGYGLRANAYISDYEASLDYLDLTHQQYLAGIHISYEPMRSMQIRFGYDHYQRQYEERKAKNSSGIRFTSNDDLRHDYDNFGLTLRQKFGPALSLHMDYWFTVRTDSFEAYDDYERHTGRIKLRYRNSRFTANAGVTHRFYNFLNSYTFDLVSEGEKELESTYVNLEMEYRFNSRYAINLIAEQDLVAASDPRSDYSKTRLALSLRWQL